jgi:hypothetical protein
MKNFVKENWYKLMIGSSMMMASFGFMIYAISPAYSNNVNVSAIKNDSSVQKVVQVPVNEDGSINVTLSSEQINELKSAPLDNIGGYYFIGTGNGIYYTSNSMPTTQNDWRKIPLK